MEIQVRDLRQHPLDIQVNLSPNSMDVSDPEFAFTDNITGEVRFQLTGPNVIARGDIHTVVSAECVKCLKPIRIPVDAQLNVVYENNEELLKPEASVLGPETEGFAYFDGKVVKPENEIREALMLELPSLPVCSEACKGLCPTCGKDMNQGDCGCAKPDVESNAWKAKLKGLHIDNEK
jgi:uncharacterized protein